MYPCIDQEFCKNGLLAYSIRIRELRDFKDYKTTVKIQQEM